MLYETSDAKFYCKTDEDGTPQIFWTDKHNGATRAVPKNPLDASNEIANCLFGRGKMLYYIKYDVENIGMQEAYKRLSVIQLDTEDFSEKIVFERQFSRPEISLGASAEDAAENIRFWTGITAFFLSGDTIYFLRGDSELMAVSRWAGKAKPIASLPIGAELSFDGRYISYQDANCEGVRYDTIENAQV